MSIIGTPFEPIPDCQPTVPKSHARNCGANLPKNSMLLTSHLQTAWRFFVILSHEQVQALYRMAGVWSLLLYWRKNRNCQHHNPKIFYLRFAPHDGISHYHLHVSCLLVKY